MVLEEEGCDSRMRDKLKLIKELEKRIMGQGK
jgi:hypothetical protein